MVCADYNNDGHPDVLVLRGGWWSDFGDYPLSLLKNNGDGTFEDVTEAGRAVSRRILRKPLLSPTTTMTAGLTSTSAMSFIADAHPNAHPAQLFHNITTAPSPKSPHPWVLQIWLR